MTIFSGLAQLLAKFFPFLKLNLLYAGIKKNSQEYITETLQKTIVFFISTTVVLLILFFFLGIKQYAIVLIISFFISFFFFLRFIFLPSIRASKRIKNLEKNLLPALQSIFVQINSGIPLFEILTNISKAGHGEVSNEFTNAVNEINAGKSQIEALEEMVVKNPSLFFRRAIWQIINGMKSGADLSITIKQTISLLAEEKLIQIQNYGARLNPLAMFYMLIGIILPALSIIFIILFVSVINIQANMAKIIFLGFYVFILLFQILFLGMINIRRPSLV